MNHFIDISGILRAKKGLLEKMLVSVENSAALLAKGDTGGFESEMRVCSDIMRRVDELESAIKESLSAEGIYQIKAETGNILNRIDKAVGECAAEAERQLGSIAGQIKQLRQTRQSMNAYSHRASGASAFYVDAKL